MASSLPIAVVIIPTYNEADSIGSMIETLCDQIFPEVKDWNCLLLIVDDTSPDGTYKIVKKLQAKYPHLKLLMNPEKIGLGGAYVKGFRHAIGVLKADVVIEFDGDFQHPPEIIPKMLKAIKNGADFVLGSRNIKGGSVPKSWGFVRLFFSKFGGGLIARILLFFPTKAFFQVTDPTTGARATRVKGFADHLDFDNLNSYQFGYKMDFLFQTVKLGAKVSEVPLQFGLRTTGESKITKQTAKDILRTVILLRWHDPTTQKLLKFGTVGFIGYIINASLLAIIPTLGGPEWLAWAGSTEAAIISNFTFNNLWTFKSDQINGIFKLIGKFLQFNLTSAGALLIQTVFGTLGVSLLGPSYRQLLLPFIIAFLVLPYNWLMYNKIIWKKKA